MKKKKTTYYPAPNLNLTLNLRIVPKSTSLQLKVSCKILSHLFRLFEQINDNWLITQTNLFGNSSVI